VHCLTVVPQMSRLGPIAIMVGIVITLILSACALTPEGTAGEQARLKASSSPFEPQIEARQILEMPAIANWQDVLSRAFLANGELESSYFEWKAAFARIDQAATWSNTNGALPFGYMFSPGNMKAWDRTTIGAGFDSSMNLSLPVKTRTEAMTRSKGFLNEFGRSLQELAIAQIVALTPKWEMSFRLSAHFA
jgi:cobalt-zinc-cadmium efflux system outer membrane protein